MPLAKEDMSLTERPGHLRLYGRDRLSSLFNQSHVARRWQSFEFEVETKVDFHPVSFQQAAGLTLYYNTDNWFFLNVTHDEELGRIVQLSNIDRGDIYIEY